MNRYAISLAGLIITGSFLLAANAPANAAPIAYDGFDYATGSPITGQTGGTGWVGAWTGDNDLVATPGLGFDTLSTIGGYVDSDNNFNGVFRTLAQQNTANGDLWGSFLVASGDSGNTNGFMGLSLLQDGGEQIIFGKLFNGSAFYNFGVLAGANNGASATGTAQITGAASLFVFQFDNTGSGLNINAWINPTPGTLTPDTTAFSVTNVADISFNRIRFDNGGGASYDYDEVRFGTTFADVSPAAAVVPEAGTLALLLPVIVGFVARRTRK
ncbi:MAG: hypothetical protein H7Y38_12960 [Armatimonadetes bacterium]|nr:hypothetical protein [Armatimonadota bacterium]